MKKTNDEFKRFDEVMAGLLSVPYTELQTKLEEEKREKEKRKKKRPTSSASSPSSMRVRKKRVA